MFHLAYCSFHLSKVNDTIAIKCSLCFYSLPYKGVLAWLVSTAFYLCFHYSILLLCAFQKYGLVQQFLLRIGVIEPDTWWSLGFFHYCVVELMMDRLKKCYNTHYSREYTSDVFVTAVAWNLLCWNNVVYRYKYKPILSLLASMNAHFNDGFLVAFNRFTC